MEAAVPKKQGPIKTMARTIRPHPGEQDRAVYNLFISVAVFAQVTSDVRLDEMPELFNLQNGIHKQQSHPAGLAQRWESAAAKEGAMDCPTKSLASCASHHHD